MRGEMRKREETKKKTNKKKIRALFCARFDERRPPTSRGAPPRTFFKWDRLVGYPQNLRDVLYKMLAGSDQGFPYAKTTFLCSKKLIYSLVRKMNFWTFILTSRSGFGLKKDGSSWAFPESRLNFLSRTRESSEKSGAR